MSAARRPAQHRQADSRFHLTVATLTGSPRMIEAVTSVQSVLNEMLLAIPVLNANIAHSDRQHAIVVRAILAGKAGTGPPGHGRALRRHGRAPARPRGIAPAAMTRRPCTRNDRHLTPGRALSRIQRRAAIDTVVVAFTDMQGRLQGKRLHGHYFAEHVVGHGTEGCNYLLAVDVEMNTVGGYAISSWEKGYGDMEFVMDEATPSAS